MVGRSLKTERRPLLKKVKYSIRVGDKGVMCTIAVHRAPEQGFELDPGASKVVRNAKGVQP